MIKVSRESQKLGFNGKKELVKQSAEELKRIERRISEVASQIEGIPAEREMLYDTYVKCSEPVNGHKTDIALDLYTDDSRELYNREYRLIEIKSGLEEEKGRLQLKSAQGSRSLLDRLKNLF